MKNDKDIIERLDALQALINGLQGMFKHPAVPTPVIQDAKAEILSLRQKLKDKDAEIGQLETEFKYTNMLLQKLKAEMEATYNNQS